MSSGPIPVLFTIPNFITAGSGRAMLNIVERLDRRRFAPAICVSRKGGRLEAYVESIGVPLIEAYFTTSVRPLPTFWWRLQRAAVSFRPYRFIIWHSFHYASDFTEALIARVAGARFWVYTKKNMAWQSRNWLLRSHLAHRIVAQNRDMLDCYFAGSRWRKKTRLIPRGVDTRRFHPEVPARLGLRAQLALKPETVVAGYVAHLVPRKAHEVVLHALPLAAGVHLWLAGQPLNEAYARQLQNTAANLGVADRVQFLGDIADVPALLAELDIFVFPSRTEGCPVALLEAMAAGLPCLAADSPGARDILSGGDGGRLLPPGDSAAWAAVLAELARSPAQRRRWGDAGRRRVELEYTIEREVAAHVALYEELWGKQGA